MWGDFLFTGGLTLIDRVDEEERKYREVVEEYEPLLQTIASDYYVPGGNREDLLQEARIALIRSYDNYDPDKNIPFSAYAALCVRRQLKDFVKAQRRKKHQVLNQAGSLEQNPYRPSDNSTDPETELLAREALDFLQRIAESCLTHLERKVLSGYLAGESYRRMARQLGKDEKTVDNALTRVRRKIAREIDQNQFSLKAILWKQG